MRSMQFFEEQFSEDLSAWLRHDFVMLGHDYVRHSSGEAASLHINIDISYVLWPSRRSLPEAKEGNCYTSSRRLIGLEDTGILILPHADPCKRGSQAFPVTPQGWQLC